MSKPKDLLYKYILFNIFDASRFTPKLTSDHSDMFIFSSVWSRTHTTVRRMTDSAYQSVSVETSECISRIQKNKVP